MKENKCYLIIVECAIEYNGKFLIIQRPEGKYAGGLLGFAGGKVDAQDELDRFDILRAAVKREILEELGLNLTQNIEYVTSEYFVADGIPSINNLFHYKFDELPKVMPCEKEVPWFGWMSKEEIYAAANSPTWLRKLIGFI